MKNLLKVGMALLITAMLFGFVGCFEPDGDDDTKKTSGVDFTNYASQNPAILFRNLSGERLVAFKGLPREENILGGVSTSSSHGLRRNSSLLTTVEAFPVFLMTEEDYIANKGKLSSQDNTPFTRVFVFYNHGGTNDVHYEISDKLGRSQFGIDLITVVNSGYNVELRIDGTAGAALGFAQAGMIRTRLFLNNDEEMVLFPVMHRYNPVRQILQTTYPTNPSNGRAIAYDVSVGGDNPNIYEIDLTKLNAPKMDIGAAYLAVNNQVTGGSMVRLMVGGQPYRNSVGVAMFGSGTKTFEVKMPAPTGQGVTGTFASYVDITDWSIGPTGNDWPIKDKTTGSQTHRLENGFMYTVTVSGNPNTDAFLTVVFDADTKTEIQFDKDN